MKAEENAKKLKREPFDLNSMQAGERYVFYKAEVTPEAAKPLDPAKFLQDLNERRFSSMYAECRADKLGGGKARSEKYAKECEWKAGVKYTFERG